MIHFDYDWQQFATFLPVWEGLSVEARAVFLEELEPQPVPLDRLGGRQEELGGTDLVYFLGDGVRCRLAEEYRWMRRGLRAMRRQPVFDRREFELRAAAISYIREHYSSAERYRLQNGGYGQAQGLASLVSSAAWLEKFQSAMGATQWEVTINRHRSGVDFDWPAGAFSVGQNLVGQLCDLGKPVAFAQLVAVTGIPAGDLWTALWCCCHDLLLFVDLCPETLQPRVGVWPGIVAWVSEPPRTVPAAVTMTDSFCLPFLAQDLARLLALCTVEPVRIRVSDGEVFAKTAKEMYQVMVPEPAWLPTEFDAYPLIRVGRAAKIADLAELVEVRRRSNTGGKPGLTITDLGQAWLALPEHEQLQWILTAFGWCTESAETFSLNSLNVHIVRSLFRFPYWSFQLDEGEEWDDVYTSLVEILKDLAAVPEGDGVDLGDFIHYVERARNPFLDANGECLWGSCQRVFPGETEAEGLARMWGDGVFQFLGEFCCSLGLVVLGTTHGESSENSARHFVDPEELETVNILMGLSSLGRFCLGLTEDYEMDSGEAGEVLIQPNFEIVFLGRNPVAEARLATVAERQGTGLGTLFRLTKASVLKAAAAGMTDDGLVDLLSETSARPVPDNVVREVRGWLAKACHLEWRQAMVVTCPDQESALRLMAELAGKAELIGDLTVELKIDRPNSALIKKLQRAGLFLRAAT